MSEVLDRTKIYIGGQWVDSDGDGSIEVVDPTTEQVIAKVAEASSPTSTARWPQPARRSRRGLP